MKMPETAKSKSAEGRGRNELAALVLISGFLLLGMAVFQALFQKRAGIQTDRAAPSSAVAALQAGQFPDFSSASSPEALFYIVS